MGKKKTHLASLYGNIESHIRALNSLSITSDKYASILYQLVESYLPKDVIQVWDRNLSLKTKCDASIESNKLTTLLIYLK